MTTRLALLRHGQTEWNRAHRIQGRTDIALDEMARAELARLSLPEPWNRAVLWSSPLVRAVDTARIIGKREPETSPALVEMDWGDWEGQRGADLITDPTSGFRNIEDWGWHYSPPGGESPGELRLRLDPWVNGLAGDNLAVCHIGVMRVILAMAWCWNFAGPCPFTIKRNRLYIIEKRDNAWHPHETPQRLIECRA